MCIGAALKEYRPDPRSPLAIDYCARCGGVWFDAGEVAALKDLHPDALGSAVSLRAEAFRMKCHECHASFERNLPACTACGWKNSLSCPICRTALRTLEHQGLRLDACAKCRGVWFDNVELAAIWNGQVQALAQRTGRAPTMAGDSDHFLLHSVLLIPDPFLAGYVIAGGVEVVGHVANAAAPIAGAALEGGAEVASSVFSVIGDIIASIFDGL